MDKNIGYTQAIAEIEAILKQFEDEKFDVDTLAERVVRATELIRLCQSKLRKAEDDVARILSPED